MGLADAGGPVDDGQGARAAARRPASRRAWKSRRYARGHGRVILPTRAGDGQAVGLLDTPPTGRSYSRYHATPSSSGIPAVPRQLPCSPRSPADLEALPLPSTGAPPRRAEIPTVAASWTSTADAPGRGAPAARARPTYRWSPWSPRDATPAALAATPTCRQAGRRPFVLAAALAQRVRPRARPGGRPTRVAASCRSSTRSASRLSAERDTDALLEPDPDQGARDHPQRRRARSTWWRTPADGTARLRFKLAQNDSRPGAVHRVHPADQRRERGRATWR